MKVAALEGAQLDYWVMMAEGWTPEYQKAVKAGRFKDDARYSSNWSTAGPIIEREGIGLNLHTDGTEWYAWIKKDGLPRGYNGSTPLIAAMRAYVASKFGDEMPES